MNSLINIKVEILKHANNLPIPNYQTAGSAGMDLYAAVTEPMKLCPLERILIPTGLKISIPSDMEAQIRPRSGLAYKHGITVLNAPGTIDSDYRGEVKVILINMSNDEFVIERGSRIAQIVIAPISKARLDVVLTLDDTKRGSKGFGSTGWKA